MKPYKIMAELNLEKIIAESREVAQALNEFADNLERIEKKYAEPQESEGAKNGQIDKQTLWNKAGTSNHITRADVNVRPPKDNSGTQALNEGFAPISQK